MSSTHYADRAARLLARSERDGRALSPAAQTADRRRGVETLEWALRARGRRRVQRRWAAAAAGLLLAAGLGALGLRGSEAVSARLASGQIVQAGASLRAAEDELLVRLSTGSELRLGRGGELGLVQLGPEQRFVLRGGRLFVRVAPLASGQRFLVLTPDAEVEVRGTSFEVAVVTARPECGGAASEVRVLEGLVTVRRAGRQWQLGRGIDWPSDCGSPPPTPGPSAAGAAAPERSRAIGAAPARRNARRAVPAAAVVSPAAPAPSSSLAEQNDLFAAAMAAQRRGDMDRAARLLDDLIARYPFGPLAASARDQRAKLATEQPRSGAAP